MLPEELIGKTVLVGLTHVDFGGEVREQSQIHGEIVAADDATGVVIRQPSGEDFTLPPAFDAFEPAEPGEYTLRSTGEVVTDPDLLCSWTITAPPRTIVEWLDHYDDQRELYEAFANRLAELLPDLLDNREIDYQWVLAFDADRTDLRADMLEAWRAGEPVTDPLGGAFRAVGVTICVVGPIGLEEIEQLIDEEFVVDRAAAETRVIYELPSYLIELDARRTQLSEWAAYAGLKLRIEVTTELHDAWRRVLEALPFRDAASYPEELRNAQTRLASELETADSEVADVVDAVDRLLDENRESVLDGELDLPLDGITLLAYLDASELVQSLVELAAELGFQHDPEDSPTWVGVESRVLWLLRREGVGSIAELDAFLRSTLPRAREMLGRLLELAEGKEFPPWTWCEDLVVWLWVVSHRADAATIELLWYHDAIEFALNTLIGNPVATRDQDA